MLGIVIMMDEVKRCFDDLFIKFCDMRKMIFGFRMLEKYVVWIGGGCNYCFGLYDGIMIKDNYIVVCGLIKVVMEWVWKVVG